MTNISCILLLSGLWLFKTSQADFSPPLQSWKITQPFCGEDQRQALPQMCPNAPSSSHQMPGVATWHWVLVPSTGQITNRRGCRGPQRGVLWQDCPFGIDGLSPRQKRKHSQDPLPNPSQHSWPRLPLLAPSPRTPLLICGHAGFVQAYLILSRKTASAGDLSGFPNVFSDELKAQRASFLHCCGADQASDLAHHLLNQLPAKTSSAKAGQEERSMKHWSAKSYLIWLAIQRWGCY